ncbi:preprotein translocase subunit SecY, partial [Candidatus Hydrogenedentota bacterium]
MIKAIQNCFKIPELRSRLLFTLGILAVYRLGAHIPSPGINGRVLAEQLASQKGGLMGFYDMFAGGALGRATVFALGIMPYISVSIIMQLLTAVVPALEKLSKEGAEGRKKITQYTRYGTVLLGLFQSFMFAKMLAGKPGIVPNPGPLFYMTTIITFTTGVIVIMWLGEQITERGIGNGMSLIICMSIVSRMPNALTIAAKQIETGELSIFRFILVLLMSVGVVMGIIAITLGQRRIPIQQARQVKGRKVYGGQRSFLPLRVNHAGVIPIIFASAIMMFPTMLGNWLQRFEIDWLDWFMGQFGQGQSLYMLTSVALIVFFCYFYTAITFNP